MVNTELATVISAAEMVATQGRAIEVKSEDDLLTAVSFLGKIASTRKAIDADRMARTKPLKDEAKKIEDAYRPVTDLLKQVDDLIRGKVNDWKRAEMVRIAEQKRQEADAEAARLAVIKANGEATEEQMQALAFRPDVPDDPIKRVHTEGGSAQFRKVWKWELVNASEVPPIYFTIDEKKIRAAIAAGERNIRGIRIYEEEQLAVSGT